jgi:hypothetical protein
VEVVGKLYYFDGVTQSPFFISAQNKCDKYKN